MNNLIDLTDCLSKNNILTGRSALAYRDFGCSSDPRVIMTIYNGKGDIYSEPRWLIPKDDDFEFEIYNNKKIATINQALYHTFIYCYDDSVFDEIFDVISDDDLMNFKNWLKIKNISKENLEKINKIIEEYY